jgi:hypothetical protein
MKKNSPSSGKIFSRSTERPKQNINHTIFFRGFPFSPALSDVEGCFRGNAFALSFNGKIPFDNAFLRCYLILFLAGR